MSEDNKKPPKQESSIFLPEADPYNVMQPWFVYENWLDPSKEIYQPRKGVGFTVHNTGAEIFPRVEEAIKNATQTVDIICWGFDPSMKLGGYQGDIRLGDLLRQKAEQGIRVRVLCWDLKYRMPKTEFLLDSPFKPEKSVKDTKNYQAIKRYLQKSNGISISKIEEEGRILEELRSIYWGDQDGGGWTKNSDKRNKIRKEKRKEAFEEFHNHYYNYNYENIAKHLSSGSSFEYQAGIPEDAEAIQKFYQSRLKPIDENNKLSFVARIVMSSDTKRSVNRDDILPDENNLFKDMLLKYGATHHQKMVLIDYEYPQHAVGFVLGHNYHKSYWDDTAHSFFSPNRWPGFIPYQDISSEVYGPVLFDLNHNFSKSWDRALKMKEMPAENLYDTRLSKIPSPDEHMLGANNQGKGNYKYSVAAAQICRTESEEQYQEQVILSLYKNAFRNATSHIYLENQYFRHPGLVDHLKEVAKKRMQPEGEHKAAKEPIYLFVLTNPPQSKGQTPYTYDMLDRLGHGNALPRVKQSLEKMKTDLEKLKEKVSNMPEKGGIASEIKGIERSKILDLERRIKEFEIPKGGHPDISIYDPEDSIYDPQKMEEYKDAVMGKNRGENAENGDNANQDENKTIDEVMQVKDAPGIKAVIGCLQTFVALSKNVTIKTGEKRKKPGYLLKQKVVIDKTMVGCYYTDIYIHSKLMTVDDAFFTLGSANINTRSFKADSELNIAVPDHQVAKETRENQWKLFANKYIEGSSLQEISEANYDHWKEVMEENWKQKHERKRLVAQLNLLYYPDGETGTPED